MDVPVHNVVLVQVLQCQDQFRNIEPRPVLTKPPFLLQMPKQLPTALVVGHKVELFLCLERKL